jgi:peptidoglycan hydrolase CwlO-like protein
MTELEGERGGKSSAEYKQLEGELKRLNTAIAFADKEIDKLSVSITKNRDKIIGLKGDIKTTEGQIDSIKDKIADLKKIDIDEKAF